VVRELLDLTELMSPAFWWIGPYGLGSAMTWRDDAEIGRANVFEYDELSLHMAAAVSYLTWKIYLKPEDSREIAGKPFLVNAGDTFAGRPSATAAAPCACC